MMNIPKELKYTKEHEWARIEGNQATVGITDYAQSELGDVVYLDLPAIGTHFGQNDAFGSIEAVKAASDLYIPMSGEIIEINQALQDAPETINQDPYGKGWMVKIKIDDASELENLLDEDNYQQLIGQ
jgi:glycine cleavage system H protein